PSSSKPDTPPGRVTDAREPPGCRVAVIEPLRSPEPLEKVKSGGSTARDFSVSALEVDLMVERLAGDPALVVLDEHRRDVGGRAERGGMGRNQEIRCPPEDVTRRQRLLLKHVEHRTG